MHVDTYFNASVKPLD